MARKDRFLVVLYLYLFSILAEIGGLYYFLKAPSAFSKGLAAAAALFMLLCFAAVVTLIILNISCAVRYFREKDGILLRQAMKGMKLGSIPFFIINFLVCLMIAAVIFGASRGFAVFLPWVWNWVLCAVASTYIIMAGSSCYGIALARLLRQNGSLSRKQMSVHIVLQLIFGLDVIDTLELLKFSAKNL